MPTIPNYKFEGDDLNAMDDLLLAKRKMLNKMTYEDKEIKFDKFKEADSKLVISNFDGAVKLLKANLELINQINNVVQYPSYVKTGKKAGAPRSSLLKESESTIVEIYDKIDKMNDNYTVLYNTIYDILPFSKYIDKKRFDTMYKLVGDVRNSFESLTFDKIQNRLGAVLMVISGNTRITAADFIERYDTIEPTYSNFYNVWKQFIKQYNATEKIPVK